MSGPDPEDRRVPRQDSGSSSPPPLPSTPEQPLPVGLEELPSDTFHQVRQILAGVLSLAAGLYDAWIEGHNGGFDISFDTILVLTGLYLISGAKGLMPQRLVGKDIGK